MSHQVAEVGGGERSLEKAEKETLSIPSSVRLEVDDRDQGYCRFCGQFAGERRALHHINFGGDRTGMGGRRHHHVDNIMTVGWLFEHDCHSIIHGNKRLWLPLTQEVVHHGGLTVLQLMRWKRRKGLL